MPRLVPLSLPWPVASAPPFSKSTYHDLDLPWLHTGLSNSSETVSIQGHEPEPMDDIAVENEWRLVLQPSHRISSCPHLSSLMDGIPPHSQALEDIGRDVEQRHQDAGLLIPSLTNDITMACLAKLPYSELRAARGVSSFWRRVLASDEFLRLRDAEGMTRPALCICLGVRTVTSTSTPSTSMHVERALVFRLYDIGTHTWCTLPPLLLSKFSLWGHGKGSYHDLQGFQVVGVGRRLILLGGTFVTGRQGPNESHRQDQVDANRQTGEGRWRQGPRGNPVDTNNNGLPTHGAGVVSSDVWCFDTVYHRWFALPSMTKPRAFFAAAALNPNEVMVAAAGGAAGGGTRSARTASVDRSAEILDLAALSWRSTERSPYPGHGCRAFAREGLFYLLWHTHPFHGPRLVHVYNPQRNTWNTLTGLLLFPHCSLESKQPIAVLGSALYASTSAHRGLEGGEVTPGAVLRHSVRRRGSRRRSIGSGEEAERRGGEHHWEPVAQLPHRHRLEEEEEAGAEEGRLVSSQWLTAVGRKLVVVQTEKTLGGPRRTESGGGGEGRNEDNFMSILSPPWWDGPINSKVLAWELRDVRISSGIAACTALQI